MLTEVGARLRERRKTLGLTQSELAGRAGLSTRFLVSMESGEGNASVRRLCDVCAALDFPLEDLFRGLGPGRPEKIALVGMRGAGKSAVGAKLARRLHVPFVELDELVEKDAGMSLRELFEIRGEASYRQIEARELEVVLSRPGAVVIATGGSLPTAPETWRRLRAGARTVWLRASPESHLRRVRKQGDLRPMRGRPDPLRELSDILREREPLYAQAERSLDTDVLGIDGTVAAIAGKA